MESHGTWIDFSTVLGTEHSASRVLGKCSAWAIPQYESRDFRTGRTKVTWVIQEKRSPQIRAAMLWVGCSGGGLSGRCWTSVHSHRAFVVHWSRCLPATTPRAGRGWKWVNNEGKTLDLFPVICFIMYPFLYKVNFNLVRYSAKVSLRIIITWDDKFR